MDEKTGTDETQQKQQFLPAESQKMGKTSVLGRKVSVPVVGLALIFCVLLAFLATIIALAVAGGSASVPPGPPTTPSVPHDPCPEDWIQYRRKCYFFSNNSRDWDGAQAFCKSYNASLAVIEEQKELDFSIRYKGRADFWIGLRKEEGEQSWKWTDGSVLRSLFVSDLTGESGCVYLDETRARAASCTMSRNWMCTKPAYPRL